MAEKRGMKELREIAEAYYNTSSNDVRVLAQKFFSSLDKDGNGEVSAAEFISCMMTEGHRQMISKEFFKQLDKDENGSLDFWEFMTVFYIIKSGRPFCGCCGDLITELFFTCTKCFDRETDPFCVCLGCYRGKEYSHEHEHFMDNYALLELKRKSGIEQSCKKQSHQTPNETSQYSQAMNQSQQTPNGTSQYSQAMKQSNQTQNVTPQYSEEVKQSYQTPNATLKYSKREKVKAVIGDINTGATLVTNVNRAVTDGAALVSNVTRAVTGGAAVASEALDAVGEVCNQM